MTALILAAMAAALIGDFRSFPIATIAGFALGVGQALVGRFSNQEGLGASLPFLVIIVVLVFRGRSLPLRDHYLQQLPMVGNGRISWAWTLFGCGAVVFVMVTKETKWIDAITVSLGVAIVLLSIVVLTGYAGQLSLAQYSIAGFGAYVAGRLVAVFDIPFLARTAGRRRRRRATRCDLRPAGGANQGDQPGDRHPRLGIHDRADAVQEPQLHRRRPGHPGREPRPVRLRHRVDQPPGPLRDLRVGHDDAGRRGRRQRATWPQRPPADRRPDQRTGCGGPGHRRDGRQALRLLAGVRHRRPGRHRPGVPAQFDQLPVLQQLHVDHLRRSGTARRGRPAARRVRRFHDGHGGDQPGGPRDDLGGGRQVDPADQRHRHPAHAVDLQGRRGRRVGQDVPPDQEDEEVEPAVHHRARRCRRPPGERRSRRPRPAANLDHRGSDGALRRGGRRPRRELPTRTRHRHRSDRTERGRQDLADRRHQWIHLGGGPSTARRRRPVEAVDGEAGPSRCRPVVPVTRVVRGLDGVREPQRRRRPAGSPLVPAGPDLAGQSAASGRGGAGHHRVQAR